MTIPRDWADDARCRHSDPELFFGADGEDDEAKELREDYAKYVCSGCPVFAKCERWALANELHGFWAGMNEDERKAARRRLVAA